MTRSTSSPSWINPLRHGLLVLVAVLVLASCGGGGSGGGSTAACTLNVKTAEHAPGVNPYTDHDGGDDAGSDSPDTGDAGAADGMYTNARVHVQTADGCEGEAEIDSTYGLVHFDLAGHPGPVLVTLKTRSDTQYFDESKGLVTIPFDERNDMHAVVPSVERNIGITMLSEAAYQYLTHTLRASWKDADKVREANEYVRNLFNTYLPPELAVTDVTRLPVMLRTATEDQSITGSANGIYGVVNAGLARAAGLLRINAADTDKPAWLISRQISRDLCDGVLDYRCEGTPVFSASSSAEAAYLIPQLGDFIAAGTSDVASRCATPELAQQAFKIVSVKVDTDFPGGYESCDGCISRRARPVYTDRTPIWALGDDGKLYYWGRNNDALQLVRDDLTFTQLISQGRFIGYAKYNRNAAGQDVFMRQAINDYDEGAAVPQYVATPPSLVELSSTFRDVSTVAGIDSIQWNPLGPNWWHVRDVMVRSKDGRALYAADYAPTNPIELLPLDEVGNNVVGIGVSEGRGRGSATFYAVTAQGKVFAKPPGSSPASELDFGDQFIVSVTGRFEGMLAITAEGNVYGMGEGNVSQGLGQATATRPVELRAFTGKNVRRIECTESHQCIALTSDGRMLLWGDFPRYSAEQVDAGADPAAMVAYTHFVEFLPADFGNHRVISVGANGWTVYGVLDDGAIVVFPSTPTLANLKVLRPQKPASVQPRSCQQP